MRIFGRSAALARSPRPPALGKDQTQRPGKARRLGGARVPHCVLAGAKGKADRCGGGGIRRPSPVRRTRTLHRYAPMRRGPFRGRQTGPHPHLPSPSAPCAGARSQRHGQCPPALAQPVVRGKGLWPLLRRRGTPPLPRPRAALAGPVGPRRARPHLPWRGPPSACRRRSSPAQVPVPGCPRLRCRFAPRRGGLSLRPAGRRSRCRWRTPRRAPSGLSAP